MKTELKHKYGKNKNVLFKNLNIRLLSHHDEMCLYIRKMNKPRNLSLLFQVQSYKSFFLDTPQSH